MNESSPDDLASLEAELAEVERRVVRRVDPGATALPVTVAVLVLVVALMLPWTGGVRRLAGPRGRRELRGAAPAVHVHGASGSGCSARRSALATRLWAAAFVCAVGCGFSVVNGVWAIWSRQVNVPHGGSGPGIGLVLAVLAMVVLTACWVRVTARRG